MTLTSIAKVIGGTLAAVTLLSAAAMAEEAGYKLLKLDGQFVKWGTPEFGSPAHVTYAFADTAIEDPQARNCQRIVPLDALALRSGLTMAAVRAEAAAAFSLWQAAGGVSFQEVDSTRDAQIVIGAQAQPRGYAFANVRAGTGARVVARPAPAGGRGMNLPQVSPGVTAGAADIAPIERSAICLNPARSWKIGFNGDADTYDLRYTFAHEIGHAIGLDHPHGAGPLMHFKYQEAYRTPQVGDVAGVVRLYGEPQVRRRQDG
ncbi:matrixin family metalloprotease [Polymorphum gilvum]|uniref:Peptidase M10A and M12B matrixin and adamalysin n=1 Tax=Polymorphum gilvum (strain LMG 25793 / CGMCC 1.9160 / SL003B-26A1) TaxID=991905 RepID=F2J2D3_POLGS|nr:matrixin family metalloprotease [Polymorphum gilvum]ADZ69829.1 Peptidase M10A and M12B matrixin and adamalysin [Polymorphum gilvum SL003B-26A1]